jgi:hypothetical protein
VPLPWQNKDIAFALDLFGAHDLDLEEARRHSSLVMTTPGLMYARATAPRSNARSGSIPG